MHAHSIRYYSWEGGGQSRLVGWAHLRLHNLQRHMPFHLHMRTAPVPTRPQDLEKNKHMAAWCHGHIQPITNGVVEKRSPQQQKAAPADGSVGAEACENGMSAPTTPSQVSPPMTIRDVQEEFHKITQVHKYEFKYNENY